VCFLLVVALIPTIIHSYIGAKENDGKYVKNIPITLNNINSTPSNRNAGWGMYTFSSFDWIERNYHDNQNKTLKLFIARSYDYKSLYHHPELAISYSYHIDSKKTIELKSMPKVPVFTLSSENNSIVIAYALLHDNKFLSSPIKHQLINSVKSIFSSSKPMTLFYVSQTNLPSNFKLEGSSLASILTAAITNFQSQSNTTKEQ